jgi:hypothetical protein
MRGFTAKHRGKDREVAISIKIRVASGCFHREHSPRAYELIDGAIAKTACAGVQFELVEHENGPEILAYIALASAVLGVAAAVLNLPRSLLDLITAVIKARKDGILSGDAPSYPIELIVRRSIIQNEVREEKILRIAHTDNVKSEEVARLLEIGVRNLLPNDLAEQQIERPDTDITNREPKNRKRR